MPIGLKINDYFTAHVSGKLSVFFVEQSLEMSISYNSYEWKQFYVLHLNADIVRRTFPLFHSQIPPLTPNSH